jgi:hypothetical protein
MRHQHLKAQVLAAIFVEQLADGEEVAERFRHLLAFDLQEAVVHPHIRHHPRAVRAGRLGDLVFVVREHQIDAAAVNVEDLAEMLPRHGRAFDVPAGTAAAPGAVPARRRRVGRLPQHEVHRVALVGRDVHARAGDHVVHRAARELAVIRHRADVEEHMPLGDIGVALGDQHFGQRDHLRHRLGGARLHGRRQVAEIGHVGLILRVGRFGDPADRLVQRQVRKVARGAGVDLVVYVRDVADIGDVLRAVGVAQQAEQHVEDDGRAGVADMGEVVDGRAADIHPHVRRVDRREGRLGAREGVVELDRHRTSVRTKRIGYAWRPREFRPNVRCVQAK